MLSDPLDGFHLGNRDFAFDEITLSNEVKTKNFT